MLGVADIRALNLSLIDAVMANPDCPWKNAIRRPRLSQACYSVYRWVRHWCAPVQDRAFRETPLVPAEASIPPPVTMSPMEREPVQANVPLDDEGLLAETRLRVTAEQEHRAAMRIAALMRTSHTHQEEAGR